MREPYSQDFKRDHFVKGRVLSVIDFRRTATELRTYDTKIDDGYVWVNVI